MLNLNLAKSDFSFPNHSKFFIHDICDYIEMYIFINKTIYGLEDLLMNLEETEKKRLRYYINDEDKKEILINGVDTVEGSESPDDNDKEKTCLKYVFKQLKNRNKQLKNNYPFEIIENDTLKLKKKILPRHRDYLMLLICTYHSIFTKRESHLITTEFEKVAYFSLLKFLPYHAITKELGKNSDLPTTTIEKLLYLSKESNIGVRKKKLKHIKASNVQEEGTDIMAWVPMNDYNYNKLVFLFQVTCQKSWFEKQFQPTRYKKIFKFSLSPNIGFFVPYLFNEGKDFCRDIDIDNSTLLFDRARILNFLCKRNGTKKLYISKLVNAELKNPVN